MMPKARFLVNPKDHTSIKCAVCSVRGVTWCRNYGPMIGHMTPIMFLGNVMPYFAGIS